MAMVDDQELLELEELECRELFNRFKSDRLRYSVRSVTSSRW